MMDDTAEAKRIAVGQIDALLEGLRQRGPWLRALDDRRHVATTALVNAYPEIIAALEAYAALLADPSSTGDRGE